MELASAERDLAKLEACDDNSTEEKEMKKQILWLEEQNAFIKHQISSAKKLSLEAHCEAAKKEIVEQGKKVAQLKTDSNGRNTKTHGQQEGRS